MKTKNNVQKAILNTFAVVVSLVLLSFSVNAQIFWKTILENNSLNEIAMAMVETETESTSNHATTSSTDGTLATLFEEETEQSMELEDWMTDDSYFNINTFSIEEEAENELQLENWMIEDTHFGNGTFTIEEESEETMKLEEWMINENHFEGNLIQIEEDLPMELESWMVSEKLWVG